MPMTFASLGLGHLSNAEKLQIARELWAEANPQSTLTEELRAELDRRLEHLRKHPEDTVPWEEVRADALRRLGVQ